MKRLLLITLILPFFILAQDRGHGGGGGKCEPEKIKCLANNNAQIGDPLCCGQSGVVQNTKYNCPSEFPTCVGYKCGESWGHCTK